MKLTTYLQHAGRPHPKAVHYFARLIGECGKKHIFSSILCLVFFLQGHLNAQITITVTGNTNTTPNLMATYSSLSAALTDLNAVTAMTGPVTLTCDGGTSETAPVKGFVLGSASLNAVLSATNTITINKTAGVVTINAAVGTSNGPSASPDGMFYLNGADHVTIDGLTFTDGNTTNATVAMEFGIALFKRVAGDGCNNNTIQNCTFNMQRINNAAGSGPLFDGSVAIGVYNSTAAAATTALTPTNGGTLATNGTNSGNKFYGNAINGGNYGIGLSGFAATAGVGPSPNPLTFLGDLSNDVGGTSSSTGNTILNYGGGAATSPAAGIRANNQWSVNISYNTIDNNNGSGVNHATTLRGIFAQAGTSANATINNNNVTVRSGATTSNLIAIDNGIGSTAASNTININNNIIRLSYTTATSGVMNAISNSSTAAAVNINSNNIQGVPSTNYPSTGTIPLIVGGSPGGTLSISNDTISNFTLTGASGTIRAITASTPTGLYTVTGNLIENISYTAVASTGSITGIYNLASATSQNVNNNIIRNFSTPTTGTLNGIQNNTVTGTFQCRDNQIYNFTTSSGGAGGFSANGITWSNTNVDISGNIIYAINSTGTTGGTGGTINGITNSGAATITRNAIFNLSSNSTGAAINGINTSATGTNTINNNLIGDLRAPNSTGNIAISGILISGGTTNNIFHNTVNIASTTTSATTFGTSAIYFSSGTPVNNVRNNVFVNTSTPGPTGGFTAAIRYVSAPTTTNFPATNNNNFYYAGTPAANRVIYCEGSTAAPTNGQQTIANYKTYINTTLPAPGRESASASEIPNFVSVTGTNPVTNFLKYDTTIPTQIEQGGGLGTGITTDYSNTTVRCPGGGCPGSASTPDMGAWELGGLLLDIVGPTITYTPLGNTACNLDRTFSATITDASGVNNTAGTKPRLYFKKSTDDNAFTGNTSGDNGWKFVEATNASSPFSFTTDYSLLQSPVSTGDIIQYFVVAQDLAGTPNVGINSGIFAVPPASVALTGAAFPLTGTINSYTLIAAGLSGTVTIGASGTYPTLTGTGGLFAAINTNGLSGDLTVDIIDATVTETAVNVLNQINYNGCVPGPYNVLIKPTTAATLTGSGTSIIRLNGADNVTIDGLNTGGNSLTLSNTSTATGTVVVFIGSQGAGQGAVNNTIKNCTIQNGTVGSTSVTNFGIFVGLNTGAANGPNNNNLTIQNNVIRRTTVGMQVVGGSSAGEQNNNVLIENNVIGDDVLANSIGRIGMTISQSINSNIKKNTIKNVITSDPATSSSNNATGIAIITGVTNSVFDANNITNVAYTSTGGYGGKGIDINTGSATSNLTLSNNMVSNIRGDGWSSLSGDAIVGIRITGTTGGVNLYYNTVNLGSGSFAGNSSGTQSAALFVNSSVTNLNIRNNIFTTNLVNTNAAAAKTWAINSAAPNTAFTAIDYNDYFVSGSQGVLGFISSDRVDLAAIQTGFGGNTNSKNVAPVFISATDLHLDVNSNPTLDAMATPIAGITTDFDGDTRNVTTPDIGADEFVSNSCAGANGGTITPGTQTKCAGETATMTATGAETGVGITYQWEVSTTGGGVGFSDVSGGTGATTTTYTTGTLAAGTYYYRLRVTCTPLMLDGYSNELQVTVNPSPTAMASSNSPVCVGANLNLTVTTDVGTSFSWAGPNSFTSTDQNPTIMGVTAAAAGTYNVTVTGGGCTSTSSTMVVVNPLPIVSSVTATPNPICAGGNSSLNVVAGEVTNTYTGGSISIPTSGNATPYPSTISVSGATGTINNLKVTITNLSHTWPSDIDMVLFGPTGAHSIIFTNAIGGSGGITNRTYTFEIGAPVLPLSGFPASGTYGVVNGSSYSGSGTPSAVTNTGLGVFNGTDPNGTWSLYVFDDASPDGGSIGSWSLEITTGAPVTGYAWSPVTYLDDPAIANPTASSVMGTTLYTVTVSSAVGCTATGSVNLTVNPLPTAVVSGGGTVCAGDPLPNVSFALTGTGPWDLFYNDGTSDVPVLGITMSPYVITNAPAGTYTVVLVSDANCAGTGSGSAMVTVNPLVSAGTISGTTPLCVGETPTFTTNGTAGGTWSSNNMSVASVNPMTGVVTALASGTATITYTVSTGCGAPVSADYMVTVNATVSAGTINGMTPLCVGDTPTFTTDGTAGGTWSTSNMSVATVNSMTGQVTAEAQGTATITYTVSTGCGAPVSANYMVTVNALDWGNLQWPPTATICEGSTFDAFGRVYEPGLTEAPGPGTGIIAEFGISPEGQNTNPSTWTNWITAPFNVQVGNDDEYWVTTGASLAPGTYYYAFRYAYPGCSGAWQYGGYSTGGGGFWDGTTYISGVLTVDDAITYYADTDGDTYGDPNVSVQACSPPMGYVTDNTDCNDGNPAVNPGATEVCNGIDDDCDGMTDEGVSTTYYADTDGDTYGDPNVSVQACSLPMGYVTDNTDCNDSDPAVNPGATEVCNGIDDNCDGMIDLPPVTTYVSTDVPVAISGTGTPTITSTLTISGAVGNILDLNVKNLLIHHSWVGDIKATLTSPGSVNIVLFDRPGYAGSGFGCQQNHILATLDDQAALTAANLEATCNTSGGFTPPPYAINGTYQSIDMLSLLNGTSPNGVWTLTVQDFEDGDGGSLEGWSLEITTSAGLLTFYADADGDTYGDPNVTIQACTAPTGYVANNTDCNDGNAAVNPGATEVCNGIDDDCDGMTDEGVLLTFYADADGDTYGDPNVTTQACSAPMGYVSNNTDCNDGNPAVNPGATEVCNGIDDDCDGMTDEGVSTTYYADADGDGYGNPNVSIQACTLPMGYVTNNLDCNDANPAIPALFEVCNGVDDNCDGNIDEGLTSTFYQDSDGDGFGNPAVSVVACTAPTGYVFNNQDCNDGNAAVYPGAPELCSNTIDDDCDGTVDEALIIWTGLGDGVNWTSGANWNNGGAVPQACNDIYIPAGANVEVPAFTNAFGRTLQVELSAVLTVALTAVMTIMP